ncbi:MAG: GlsB/YeaQ/YmgE family stress response membrane protein [Alphaproteobacteria bacterium]|nr:GlsB/YeaQ/YmgE family stress response membrane protein [Alphaproteobacteria bacterium]
MLHIIRLLVIGLIVGIIARFVYPGPVPLSLGMSILLGIAGSYVAGLLGLVLHSNSGKPLHPAGFFYSIAGAVILIYVARNVLHIV